MLDGLERADGPAELPPLRAYAALASRHAPRAADLLGREGGRRHVEDVIDDGPRAALRPTSSAGVGGEGQPGDLAGRVERAQGCGSRPAASAGTANRHGPAAVRATTSSSSAVAPSTTSGFSPVTVQPPAVRTAAVPITSVDQEPEASATANVAVDLPAAIAGRWAACAALSPEASSA